MTQTDPYALDERQLGLVFNLPYYAALYLFRDPLTPSEVARRLNVPANVMHYRAKRLLEAGLLEIADDNGRSRTYKSVASTFSIAPDVLPAVTEALPAMLEGMLGKVHRNFLGRVETELQDLGALLEHGPVTFELSESLTLGTISPHEYPVWTSLATRSLSATQYQKIVKAVSALLDEVEAEEGEKPCTLSFLAFQGRGAP